MSGRKTKILVADDENSLRTLLRAVIEAGQEFEISEAVDGEDALLQAQKNKPDIMILDVMMPGLSGFEVCEKIKTDPKLKGIIVIILTAKGQQTDKDWARSVGADYFLTKPFSPTELLSLVEKIASEYLSKE
jgi:CheY-like chemotaxis protein